VPQPDQSDQITDNIVVAELAAAIRDGQVGEEPSRQAKRLDTVPVDEDAPLGPARHVTMTIIAQDPSVLDERGRILMAQVRVAADRFRAPFQTHRFHGVSYDPITGGPGLPIALLDRRGRFVDQFDRASDNALLTSQDFHLQNVFAIASRTLASFEAALGRRVPWDFETHQLYLVPHGEIRANAGYSPPKQALIFGYVTLEDGRTLYSCLSHDVIAHETTHAVLDGLRPGYFTAGLPDQGAFHEGFADVVALLSVFAVPSVAERAIGFLRPEGLVDKTDVSRAALKRSIVLQIAEQFGEAVHGHRGKALRESVRLRKGTWWRDDPAFREVHNRGEILVAAVASAFLDMWTRRLRELLRPGKASRKIAAEEGAKAAEHLLNIVIRAIDYCPPIEFEFEDFLDAILWSDSQMVPDDDRGYRRSIRDAFHEFGIDRPTQQTVEISKLHVRPVYERFNFAALRSDRDEVFRFIWENDELLGLSLDFETEVNSVRPSIRVGPDGFIVSETVVTYTQHLRGTVGELASLSKKAEMRFGSSEATLQIPPGLDGRLTLDIYGGGSLIFDQFGRPKLHLYKPLLDWDRQSRRLEYLARTTEPNTIGAIGGRPGSRVDPLAALHNPETFGGERW
jgi:hypothetical protein